MTDHTNVQRGGSSHAASHPVVQVHVQNVAAGVVDDASSLSKTEGENAKSESCYNSTLQAWPLVDPIKVCSPVLFDSFALNVDLTNFVNH